MRLMTVYLLFVLQPFIAHALADDSSCEFLRPPKAIRRVSLNPSTPLKIRFTLNYFEEFCVMRVKIPSNTLVTFNLTRDDREIYPGDKLATQMNITQNKKTLMIVNVDKELFGSRFGRYQLNQQEVYGVPYYQSLYRPILDGSCSANQDDTFEISGKLETSRIFQRCLQYNKDKERNQEEYLFCPTCKTKPTFNEDNTMLNFDVVSVSETELSITCQIKSVDDRVNYTLRFVPRCTNSSP